MKTSLAILVLMFVLQARALTRAQAIADYKGCLTFLKDTRAQQAKIAARTGISIEDSKASCLQAKAMGQAEFVKEVLAEENGATSTPTFGVTCYSAQSCEGFSYGYEASASMCPGQAESYYDYATHSCSN